MIRYSVICHKNHEFDGWFASSDAFDRQSKRGLVTCPKCGSTKVTKALMAPAISSKTRAKGARAATPVKAPAKTIEPTHAAGAMPAEMLELMRKVRKEVTEKAEYVGPRFAEEARKIHEEESPARGIYGEASADEVKSLHEDGIDCFPLPILPEDHN